MIQGIFFTYIYYFDYSTCEVNVRSPTKIDNKWKGKDNFKKRKVIQKVTVWLHKKYAWD